MIKNLFFIFILIAWSMTIYLGMRYYLGRALHQQKPQTGISESARQRQEMSDRASRLADQQKRLIEQNTQKMERMQNQQRMMQETQKRMLEMRTR